MAWARLLYHNPKLAFLDEATSAVSEDLVCIMYKEKGITLVSVGHRGSLRQFHQKVLSLWKSLGKSRKVELGGDWWRIQC